MLRIGENEMMVHREVHRMHDDLRLPIADAGVTVVMDGCIRVESYGTKLT